LENHWDTPLPIGKTAREFAVALDGDMTYASIALELNKMGFNATRDSVRSMLRRLDGKEEATIPVDSKPQVGEAIASQSFNANTWNLNLNKTQIASLDDLVKAYKIDLSVWEVVSFSVSRHESFHGSQAVGESKNWAREDDEWTVQPLNAIKAQFRKRVEVDSAKKEIEALKEQMRLSATIVPSIPHFDKPTGNVLELCLPDTHFGKVAWAQQTGYEDYDVKIAQKVYEQAIGSILARVEPYKFDKILFVIGNDVFNSDSTNGQTFGGTQVESDSRYHRTFKVVREVMVDTIERLRLIAPVDVVVIAGNHDKMTAWHLGDSIECYFHGYQDVKVDNSPKSRKYYKWGKVMLAFAHGDHVKRDKFAKLIASEQPKMWGETVFREVHTGDKHQSRVEEEFGFRFRILPSLSGTDAWHSENGFVGNLRQAEAFVWNNEEGLLGTAIYTYK